MLIYGTFSFIKMSKEDIILFLKQHKKEIENNFGVKKIGLAGSYARNESNPNSDVDILVEIESENKFRSFFGLLYFLQDKLNIKIDLGIESALKPIIKESILEDIIYV